MDTPDAPRSRPDTGQIVVGLIILSMGGLLLLDRLSEGTYAMRAWWPFILIVMGAAKMANAPAATGRERGGRRSGVWLVLVGLWGLVNEWRLFGLTYGTSWPLLVMASGAMMVWRSFDARTRATSTREP
jgi:hypothetical protein